MSDETTPCHEDGSPVCFGFFLSEFLLLTPRYRSRVYHHSKTGPTYLYLCRNSTRALSLRFLTITPFLIPKVSPAQPTGGRRRRATEMDPDERRQRFLERNRAAASRCRQKRKLWVNSLEKKADDLANINASLTVSPLFPVLP